MRQWLTGVCCGKHYIIYSDNAAIKTEMQQSYIASMPLDTISFSAILYATILYTTCNDTIATMSL